MDNLQSEFNTISSILADVAPLQVHGDPTLDNFRRMLLVARDEVPAEREVCRLLFKHSIPDRQIDGSPITDVILAKATTFGTAVRKVCRIKAATSGPGTGFLVGPNLVMTAAHVLRTTAGAWVLPHTVKVDFDVLIWSGDKIATRVTRGLAEDWLVASSLAPMDSSVVPTENDLDYVIVKIDTSLGSASLPSSSNTRGWFDGSTDPGAPATDEKVSILQHPKGEVMRVSEGKVRALTVNSTRVLYSASTDLSSSGSPVVNAAQQLVALHVWDDRVEDTLMVNEGVAFSAIHADLKAKGKDLPKPV